MKQEDDETIFHHELLPNSCLIIIDRNVPQTQGLFSNVSGYFLSGFCVSSRVTRLIYLHTTYERRKYMNERLNLERKLFKEDFSIKNLPECGMQHGFRPTDKKCIDKGNQYSFN